MRPEGSRRDDQAHLFVGLEARVMLLALHAPAFGSARTSVLTNLKMQMDPCPRLPPPVQSATSNTVTLALG